MKITYYSDLIMSGKDKGTQKADDYKIVPNKNTSLPLAYFPQLSYKIAVTNSPTKFM